MPTRLTLWRVGADRPVELPSSRLNLEARLEDWITRDPSILGIDLLILGTQVATAFGGKIDVLAINAEGDLVVVELKRDKTPREVVAQVLDYASWVKSLTPREIYEIASDYLARPLDVAFSEHFRVPTPESINANHGMLIVASELDDSSERIVNYLTDEYGVNINAIFFTFFSDAGNEFLGRSWLANPEAVASETRLRRQPPWTGYWYVNIDEGESRSWADWKEYGFLSAGGGRKYSDQLQRLPVGAKVFAYQKDRGYVGYGSVESAAVPASEFLVPSRGTKLFELPLAQPGIRHDADDVDRAEYVVPVDWIRTVDLSDARRFAGIFANQNIVCKLRDERTLEFLAQQFGPLEESPDMSRSDSPVRSAG